MDLARTLARQFNVDAGLFLVLPNQEDEKTFPSEPKSNNRGVWRKYHVTSEDYQRYNKRKIVFAGLRSRVKLWLAPVS